MSDRLADAQLDNTLVRNRLSHLERTMAVANERLKELDEENKMLREMVKDLKDVVGMVRTDREEDSMHLTELTEAVSALQDRDDYAVVHEPSTVDDNNSKRKTTALSVRIMLSILIT